MTAPVVIVCIAALLLLAVMAALGARASRATPLVYGSTAVICLVAFFAALLGDNGALTLPVGLPWLGAHVRVDRLSAVFLALVDLGGAGASLYAIGYGRHEHAPHRVLPFFPAFIAGMNLVVIADDAYTFLFAWELMSLASWALVMADHRSADSRRAGIVYLIMATFSALTLLLAFGLLAATHGSYAFADMRTGELPPWRAGLVLTLALVGAGSKAGLMPLHAWLPLAHPAAPSHVSALMSGVMTKVAIYAFIRIVFDLLGPATSTWWWAVPVLTTGGTAAVLGVLHALMAHDLKRLLAYSTIENVGIVFIGLGLALAFRANAMPAAAALALTAALFHAFNHMLFKSVLFFGAGSVLVATGERNIERLGGLIRVMPISAACVLTGCMAASALPPLNGFASEWLTFQTILVSPALPQWGLRLLVPTVGTLLALAAALAAACFVRAYGIAWLGRPRSACVDGAHEADRFSLAAMIGFSGLCVLAGLFPGVVIDALSPAVQMVVAGGCSRSSACPGCPSCRSPTAAAPTTRSRYSCSSLSPRGWAGPPCIAWAAGRCGVPGYGIAATLISVPPPNTRPPAIRNRFAGCSARWCSVPPRRSSCRRPVTCRPRALANACTTSPGRRCTNPCVIP